MVFFKTPVKEIQAGKEGKHSAAAFVPSSPVRQMPNYLKRGARLSPSQPEIPLPLLVLASLHARFRQYLFQSPAAGCGDGRLMSVARFLPMRVVNRSTR